MKISHIKDAIYIGHIVNHEKAYTGQKPVFYSHKLKVNYSKHLEKGLADRHLSIVYFFCVNDQIYKIGQTSGKNGIKGCMNFYCGAGQDDPGPNRFTINALIREQLKLGNDVSVYIKFIEPITIPVPGINKVHEISVPVSAKGLEEVHLQDYREIMGSNPPWNFQESGTPVPTYINEQFAEYRRMRAEDRV